MGDLDLGCEPAERVAVHLKLHGVHAQAAQIALNKGDDAEEKFLSHAAQQGAELIVMGAYAHSRLQEMIWGGFTRHLLRESPIPLFMAH